MLRLLVSLLTHMLLAGPQEPPRVVPVYLVPGDYPVPLERVRYHARVIDDVRAWYARATGGWTFTTEPLVVQISRHRFAELAADSFQAWWPLLQREFADYGLSWNRHSRIKLLFLAHGAGAWAGADSENGGIDSIAAAGRIDKGAWGGLAVIGDSTVGGVLAGVCPEAAVPGRGERGRGGGTAWWCSGSTYRGTVAHELGHTWGLPHPDAFREGFRCADSTAYTIMQCHWEYPRERLLDYEVMHLRSLIHFRRDATPAFMLLTGVGLDSAAGVRVVRLDAGDEPVWVGGRGGGTGYLWAVVLAGAGAWAGYTVPAGRELLVADVGVPRGTGAAAAVRVVADGRAVALVTVEPGAPPQRLVVPLRSGGRLRLAAESGSGAAVLGNARLY